MGLVITFIEVRDELQRVLPRDLFNESSLLKCYGKLWIHLERTQSNARFVEEDVEEFDIQQNEEDGSLTVANLAFKVGDEECILFRPLNSRAQWPLYAMTGDEEFSVFDDQGELGSEFLEFIQREYAK